eukprot:184345-Pyramimonas_sp.AAC.1
MYYVMHNALGAASCKGSHTLDEVEPRGRVDGLLVQIRGGHHQEGKVQRRRPEVHIQAGHDPHRLRRSSIQRTLVSVPAQAAGRAPDNRRLLVCLDEPDCYQEAKGEGERTGEEGAPKRAR